MDQTTPQRGSQHRDAAPQARTFSRRIDCADAGRRAAFAVATRGGGMREPERREPLRAHVRD
jgi:hypothetical protein